MSPPTPPFAPSSELVCKAWLVGISGLPSYSGVPGVAAQLPRDASSWPDGFVTFLGLGGIPVLDNPISRTSFQIDTWAVAVDSNKPPWGVANQLAQLVQKATYPHGIRGLNLGTAYKKARVMAAIVRSEPRRFFTDQGAAARYTMTIELTWAEA